MDYNELILLAQSKGEEEKWEECIYYYEQAFLDNDNVYIYDYLDYALAHLENGDKEKSLAIIDEVIEENSDVYVGYHYKGLYYFNLDFKLTKWIDICIA